MGIRRCDCSVELSEIICQTAEHVLRLLAPKVWPYSAQPSLCLSALGCYCGFVEFCCDRWLFHPCDTRHRLDQARKGDCRVEREHGVAVSERPLEAIALDILTVLRYELEEVETLIRDFRSLIPSSQAPGFYRFPLKTYRLSVSLDYYEGPLSTEYKAIRAAMISHDKARFWEAIDDMRLTLNQELAQKLNCNEEVRRDLQTRSNLLSTRKDSSGGIQTSTSIISSGL